MKLNTKYVLSFVCFVPDVAHEALVEEVIGVGGVTVSATFNIHLVAKFLQSSFERVAGGELGKAAIRWLDVLHVFFSLDLDDCRFSEYHDSNLIIGMSVPPKVI